VAGGIWGCGVGSFEEELGVNKGGGSSKEFSALGGLLADVSDAPKIGKFM